MENGEWKMENFGALLCNAIQWKRDFSPACRVKALPPMTTLKTYKMPNAQCRSAKRILMPSTNTPIDQYTNNQ